MKSIQRSIKFAVLLFIISILTSCAVKFKTIRPGNVGVKTTFGKIHDEALDPGLKVYFFGTRMYRIDTRIIDFGTKQNAIAKDGVELIPKVSVFYSINPDKVSQLISEYNRSRVSLRVFPRDFRSIVQAKVHDAMAKVISESNSFEEVNQNRSLLAQEITDKTNELITNDYFIIHSVLVNEIDMSREVRQHITHRAVIQQEMTNIEYEIALRQRQIELAKIEAEAEKAGYEIIQPTLSPEVLRKAEIDALREAGKNSSSIIIRD